MKIFVDDKKIKLMGRLEYTARHSVRMFHPGCAAFVKFRGGSLFIDLINVTVWGNISFGFIIDGEKKSFPADSETSNFREQRVTLCENLENKIHEVIFYKKNAGNNSIEILSFETDGEFLEADDLPDLKIEVYGDSVCAGEVIEAAGFEGKPDPENHDGAYDDVWDSFVMQTARNLNARIHNISQGGIALLNGTGYFNAPDYIGIESMFDKICFVPSLGEPTHWDFSCYRPDIVILAFGQNDKHNGFTGAEDIDISDEAYRRLWKSSYIKFVNTLDIRYESPVFILTTTILIHDPEWDAAIGEVRDELMKSGIKAYHNIFKRNGTGTPGHPRLSEHNEMAGELTEFIKTLRLSPLM